MSPSHEDYEAMHKDSVIIMEALEGLSGVAKRMSCFSSAMMKKGKKGKDEDSDDKPSSKAKALVLTLKKKK